MREVPLKCLFSWFFSWSLLAQMRCGVETPHHTLDYASLVSLDAKGLSDHSEGFSDQICTTYGPKVNCVMRVDF